MAQEDLKALWDSAKPRAKTAGEDLKALWETAKPRAAPSVDVTMGEPVGLKRTPADQPANASGVALPEMYDAKPALKAGGLAAANSGALGFGPQVLAAEDAVAAVTGHETGDTPVDLTDLKSLYTRVKKLRDMSNTAAARLMTSPIETLKQAHSVYKESVPKYRAGFAEQVEKHPLASFGGAVLPSLVAGVPKGAASVMIPAAVASAASNEDISSGDVSAGSLAKTGLGAGFGAVVGALGYKAPVVAGAGALGAAALGEKLGLSDAERTQLVLAGGLGVGAGLAGRFSKRNMDLTDSLDDARGKVQKKIVAEDHADAKWMNSEHSKKTAAVKSADSELATSKKAGLKLFDRIQERSQKNFDHDVKLELKRLRQSIADGDVAPQDVEAKVDGILGNEIKEGFQFMRTEKPLDLKLGDAAQAGKGAILPDYEAKANDVLGKFAEGKTKVRDGIRARVLEERAAETSTKTAAKDKQSKYEVDFYDRAGDRMGRDKFNAMLRDLIGDDKFDELLVKNKIVAAPKSKIAADEEVFPSTKADRAGAKAPKVTETNLPPREPDFDPNYQPEDPFVGLADSPPAAKASPPDMRARIDAYVDQHAADDVKRLPGFKEWLVSKSVAGATGAKKKDMLPATTRAALLGRIEKYIRSDRPFAKHYAPSLKAAAARGEAAQLSLMRHLTKTAPDFADDFFADDPDQ